MALTYTEKRAQHSQDKPLMKKKKNKLPRQTAPKKKRKRFNQEPVHQVEAVQSVISPCLSPILDIDATLEESMTDWAISDHSKRESVNDKKKNELRQMVKGLLKELFAPIKEKDKTERNIDLAHSIVSSGALMKMKIVCILMHSNDLWD